MHPLLRENKKTFALATPIIAGQLGQMLLGLVDTLMIGRIGTVELAVVAFVNVIFHFAFVLGIGLFAAVSIQVAHAYGENRRERVAEAFRHGFLVSCASGFVFAGLLLGTIPFLDVFRQPEAVTAMTPDYLVWIALSLIPMVPAMTIKSFAEALNRPWTVFWLMMGGVLANVVLNYLLIFGNWGFPALGLEGAGIATFLARLGTVAALWLYLRRSEVLSPHLPSVWRRPLRRAEVLDLFKIAGPIAGQLSMEFGAFAFGALLIGQFGPAALAAHQITLTCCATSFMLPLGFSMALTIRVGHSVGGGHLADCRRIVLSAHLCGLLIMCLCALAFVFGGELLARAFTADPEVIAIAATLFTVAAFFQIGDGAQVLSNGALRGLRDVNLPTLLIFISFWLISLPLGAFLAFRSDLGPTGIWAGLAAGICTAAVALTWRLAIALRPTRTNLPAGSRA